MHFPHITVACNVAAQGKLLLVEETINQRPTLNQPAGHLEPGETLIQAASRELFEETGIKAEPDALVAVQQWIAPDNTPFIRFLFPSIYPTVVWRHPSIPRLIVAIGSRQSKFMLPQPYVRRWWP